MFRDLTVSEQSMQSLSSQFHDLTQNDLSIRGVSIFLRQIYQHGKMAEMISFIWWELLYLLGFLRTVKFTKDSPIIPSSDWLNITDSLSQNCPFSIYKSAHNWKLYCCNDEMVYGCQFTSPCDLYFAKAGHQQPKKVYQFSTEILSLFSTSRNIVFACLGDGTVYRSVNNGQSFDFVLRLTTTESVFRFDYGITETRDGQLIIGEYANVAVNQQWLSVAYLYSSSDEGITWNCSNFLQKQGVNKHVHLVKYSEKIDSIILTDGDNKKLLWTCKMGSQTKDKFDWRLINKYHFQTGGYISMIETSSGFLFGTDYYGGTNFIVASPDCQHFEKQALPTPYRKCPVFGLAKRNSCDGIEIWANLHFALDAMTKSLLMCSIDEGISWRKVIEYDGTKNKVHFVSNSSSDNDSLYFASQVIRLQKMVHL